MAHAPPPLILMLSPDTGLAAAAAAVEAALPGFGQACHARFGLPAAQPPDGGVQCARWSALPPARLEVLLYRDADLPATWVELVGLDPQASADALAALRLRLGALPAAALAAAAAADPPARGALLRAALARSSLDRSQLAATIETQLGSDDADTRFEAATAGLLLGAPALRDAVARARQREADPGVASAMDAALADWPTPG